MTPSEEHGTPVLDVRTYKLVPGARGEFDRLFRARALPMLERYGIDVVAYGPSLDDDGYCLIRAFPSAARRTEQLDAFYGSDEWRRDLRDAAMALVEAYHIVAIPFTPARRTRLWAATPERSIPERG